jgi:hypothetical protein
MFTKAKVLSNEDSIMGYNRPLKDVSVLGIDFCWPSKMPTKINS